MARALFVPNDLGELSDEAAVESITERGCKLYRSANGIATTIEAVQPDGTTPLKFEVIDAAYRKGGLEFGAYNINNPDLKFFANKNTSGTWYIDGDGSSNNRKSAIDTSITISFLVSLWYNSLNSIESAQVANASWYNRYKNRTDSTGIKGVPAVEYCMGLTNDGGGWLLANIWEDMITFMLSDKLDEMDSTAEDNPSLKLGRTATNGRFSFGTDAAWSCTEFSISHCRRMRYDNTVGGLGRSNAAAAIPIRELS